MRDGLHPVAFSTSFFQPGSQFNHHPFQHLGGIEICPLGTYVHSSAAGYVLYPGTDQRFHPLFESRDGQTE